MNDVIADWPRNRILSLLVLGRRHGLDEATMLAGTSVTLAALSGSEHGAEVADEYAVIRNLLAAIDPDVPAPLEAGLDFHLLSLGGWGQGMRTSPNLGSALAFGLGFAQQMPTAITVTAEIDGPDLRLTFDDGHLPEDVRSFITMRNMVFTDMTARELLGRQIPIRGITARMSRPPYAAALHEFCGSEVTWDADITRVVTDASILAEPLAAADPDGHAEALRACYQMLERHRRRVPAAGRVLARLRRDKTFAGLARVAQDLGMSERNLRRLLAADGTSFRELLDRVRHERARELLAGDTGIDEIAMLLGYSEPASFSRAFKRWSGTTPAAHRSRTRGTTPPEIDTARRAR